MDMTEIQQTLNAPDRRPSCTRMIDELYPICRSITGNGVRGTLRGIRQHIPVEVHEVPSGTQVFDWKVPLEMEYSRRIYRDSGWYACCGFQAMQPPRHEL